MTACSCVLRWILIALAGAPAIGWAAVFTVVNTNDSGAGSLRQAILDANMTPGFDEIHFNIAGGGVQTIGVTSALPGINDPVLIDGYTQPGSAANTAGIGTNAQIRIEVQRAATFTGGSFIFLVGSGGSTIRGLAVNSFYAAQIAVTAGSADCVVAGNFIGTDATGTIGYPGEPGTRVGLEVGGDRCRIGGTARADRNLVSGLSNTGIHVGGDDVVVQGNLVGTDASGGNAIGVVDGIVIGAAGFGASPSGVVIGGAGGGNVISGNSGNGILVESGENHSILTNLIGLAAFPLATIPNEGAGILVRDGSLSTIGSQVAGNANAIAGNLGPGVLIGGSPSPTPQGWFVVGNAIFGNGGLPIDLGLTGVTPNDPLDADDGANSLQNFPEITQVTYTATETHFRGRLESAPDDLYRIDFYTVASCDPSGHGGASTYLDLALAVTDLSGHADFEYVAPSILDAGYVTATASRGEDLATSEFSTCVVLGDELFADGFDGA